MADGLRGTKNDGGTNVDANYEDLQKWSDKGKNTMFDPTGKQTAGCDLKFDTCLGINDKEIQNQMQIVGEAQIIFTSGATIVIKDIQFKTQQVLSNEGKLRNVTALYSALDKNKS